MEWVPSDHNSPLSPGESVTANLHLAPPSPAPPTLSLGLRASRSGETTRKKKEDAENQAGKVP